MDLLDFNHEILSRIGLDSGKDHGRFNGCVIRIFSG